MDLLTGGEKNTEVVQMLRMIGDFGWNGLVVVELRPSELPDKKIMGQLPHQSLTSAYTAIRETLFQTLDR